MFAAVITEVVRNEGHAHFHHLLAVSPAVRDAVRVLFEPFVAIVAELVLFVGKEIEQFLPVYRTALGAAYGIEVQNEVIQA